MPATQLARQPSASLASFEELCRRIQESLLRAQQQIEAAKIRSAWEIGGYINEHIKIHGGRAKYGEKTLLRISNRFDVSEKQLSRFSDFTEKFPDWEEILTLLTESFVTPHKTSKKGSNSGLIWSHFLALLSVKEDEVRWRLARQAAREGWTVEKLEAGIQGLDSRLKHSGMTKKDTLYSLLKPRTGKLYTYRVLDPNEVRWPDHGGLLLDQGFRGYLELTRRESSKLKTGDIVQIVGANPRVRPTLGNANGPTHGSAPTQEIIPSTRTEKERYFYVAYVQTVVDGDTLWASIDLGMSGINVQKLRLQGVDAAEIDTPKGKKACRFLKSLLSPGLRILMKTSKWPNFDRFVADVFIPVNPETQKVVERTQPKGIQSKIEMLDAGAGLPRSYYFLNNLLLERRLAVREKEIEQILDLKGTVAWKGSLRKMRRNRFGRRFRRSSKF